MGSEGNKPEESAVHEISALCRACIDDVRLDGGGISLMTEHGYSGTVWVSDVLARHVEELQFVLGEGPCVDAAASGAPVLEPELAMANGAAVRRWPAFTPEAVQAGVQAIFGLPLTSGTINIGALDLFRCTPGALSDGQLDHVREVAEAASSVLIRLETKEGQEGQVGVGSDVSAYHWTVHQAAGMISEQLRVEVGEALVKLRAAAFSEGRSIDELAADVVERRRRFSEEER